MYPTSTTTRTANQAVLALLLPSTPSREEEERACRLRLVSDSRAHCGVDGTPMSEKFTGAVEGVLYVCYGFTGIDLPDNPRAATLAARLGFEARALLGGLRGDVLFTGVSADSRRDLDVPAEIIAKAATSGIRVDTTAHTLDHTEIRRI